ncbi:MAG: cob(I)yrinic acid a,c-diamide adenosyltransferase [Nitrososphaeraceae archaeon]|jgi:cob(I)alamin adenosyltransferase|nr:cob(I)yrinic acid a,c-diamide adenosyltransferase [Nitrososphaeraceae archaeon]MDW0333516.1 cob(I)yrinic acid a,c-diamide adenosyltransferase [Nitrososphaeraceae archaeon]
MKIYTRTGDKGETGLIGGKRVSKDNSRIIAYGSVDELNSNIGLVISLLSLKDKVLFRDIINLLTRVQNDLFIIGSDLADPRSLSETQTQNQLKIPRVTKNMISHLEVTIDKFEMQLTPIAFFILPGGSIESSSLHISRSIARRAEIATIALSKSETINLNIIVYLNRLSDLLFVCGRLVNKGLGVEDLAWTNTS